MNFANILSYGKNKIMVKFSSQLLNSKSSTKEADSYKYVLIKDTCFKETSLLFIKSGFHVKGKNRHKVNYNSIQIKYYESK